MILVCLCWATGNASAQNASSPATSGALISEFRFHGQSGSADEYVEIFNTLALPLNISGWSIKTDSGIAGAPTFTTTVVPANTVLPAYGRFLFAGSGYSLEPYGSQDATIGVDANDDSGVALFNAAGIKQDAVGFSTSDAMFRLSADTGLKINGAVVGAPVGNGQYAFVRKFGVSMPQVTANNSGNDFVFIKTSVGAVTTTGAALPVEVGAPSPEGTTSPLYLNYNLGTSLLSGSDATAIPNRQRYGSGNDGYLILRRKITNNTNRTLSKIRFVSTHISGVGTPVTLAKNGFSQAELLPISSQQETVSGQVVFGTTLEAPSTFSSAGTPEAPATPFVAGSGLNSSVTFDLGTPLDPGATRAYSFKFAVKTGGYFEALFNIHALPNPALGVDTTVHTGDGLFVGANASSSNGLDQSVRLTVDAETNATYYVRVQNRASTSQAMILRGTAGTNGWDVSYWNDALPEEERDITAPITSPDGYTTPVIGNAPQDYFEIRVSITPHTGVTPGARLLVTLKATSSSDAAQSDTVQLETTRRVPPPDIALRAGEDEAAEFLGLGTHDASGQSQTQSGLTIPNRTLVYIAKLSNQSGFSQSLKLGAPADASGWTTRVYDGPLADAAKNITSAVLQGGWPLELASGAEREVRIELTPGENAASSRVLPVALSLAGDASNTDVARIDAAMQKIAKLQWSYDGTTWSDFAPDHPPEIEQFAIIGVRAIKNLPASPWPEPRAMGPKWSWQGSNPEGDTVWLQGEQVTGEAGEAAGAEYGASLLKTIRVLPIYDTTLTVNRGSVLAGNGPAALKTVTLSALVTDDEDGSPKAGVKVRFRASDASGAPSGEIGTALPADDIVLTDALGRATAVWSGTNETGEIKLEAMPLDEKGRNRGAGHTITIQSNKSYTRVAYGAWTQTNGAWSRSVTVSAWFMGSKDRRARPRAGLAGQRL